MPPVSLFVPRYWPQWFGIGLLWLLTRLPWRWQLILGAGLGRTVGALAKRRRHIVDVNLTLCFPDWEPARRQALRRAHFAAAGMGIMETALAWWGDERRLRPLIRIEGLEHIHHALARKQGAILFTGHFTAVELGSRFLGKEIPGVTTYRANENPLLEYLLRCFRQRYAVRQIPRENIRKMLRALGANYLLWFAPDQNFGHKSSVFASFFGIPAATGTATSRLARISNAPVIPFFVQRRADGYILRIHPPLENFPGDSEQADTERLNFLLEQAIRQAPEQYLWSHRRFKDRPPGEPGVY